MTGGQYDTLMAKMGRKAKAIGFALYPDNLERIAAQDEQNDTSVLFYDKDTPLHIVAAAVKELVSKGYAVSAKPNGSQILPATKAYVLTDNGIKEVEQNA